MPRPSAARTTTAATQRSATRKRRQPLPQAFVPGPKNRKSNKPLDAGARVEETVKRRLRRHGFDIWRNPGIRLTRLSNKGMRLDCGAYLPELAEFVQDRIPAVPGRPVYNVLVSVKSQRVGGSVEQKMVAEIIDLASGADQDRVVPMLLIDATVFTPGQIADWKQLGKQEQVVVLTLAEATGDVLRDALVACAKARARLYRRIGPKGGLPGRTGRYRFTEPERAYIKRRQRLVAATRADLAA